MRRGIAAGALGGYGVAGGAVTLALWLTAAAYTLYAATAPNLPSDHSMLLTAPLVLFGLLRYCALARARPERQPDELIFGDRALVLTLVAFAVVAPALLVRAG